MHQNNYINPLLMENAEMFKEEERKRESHKGRY